MSDRRHGYDGAAGSGLHEREVAAADKLLSRLPVDQARRMRLLRDEFEERRTPDGHRRRRPGP